MNLSYYFQSPTTTIPLPGEALELPIWEVDGLKNVWMYELLYAFREGKYEYYDACMKKYGDSKIKQVKQLSEPANQAMIYEKFCCCVLMEFAFQQPKSKRRIDLKTLAGEVRVADVETLLINAMCADLIRSSIDEVEGTFSYTWVRPRHLDPSRLALLQTRVLLWFWFRFLFCFGGVYRVVSVCHRTAGFWICVTLLGRILNFFPARRHR